MKKILGSLSVVAVLVVSLFAFAGCAPSIDNATWRTTKAIISADGATTGLHSTKEERQADTFTAVLNLTMSVTFSEVDRTITVEKSKFTFSTEPVSFILKGLTGGDVGETLDLVGRTADDEDASTSIRWVKLEVNFGSGLTYDEVQELRSGLKMSYKGHDIGMPKTISFK